MNCIRGILKQLIPLSMKWRHVKLHKSVSGNQLNCAPHSTNFRHIFFRLQFVVWTKWWFKEEKAGGTQIKMTMYFDNGMLALSKPMRSVHLCVCVCTNKKRNNYWYESWRIRRTLYLCFCTIVHVNKKNRFARDQQTLKNVMLYADYERHTADIAAFHLDR